MIDRKAREQMMEAIRSYMDDKMTAFDFDDALIKITEKTFDATVKFVGEQLWYYYDDLKDHKIHASKEVWDFFNRLLLLLQSERKIEVVTKKHWHFSQAIAAASMALFTLLILVYFLCVMLTSYPIKMNYVDFLTGFIKYLVFALPFGVISIIIEKINQRQHRKVFSSIEAAVFPFSSISSLFSVRRSVPGFVKTRYPQAISISDRKVRGPIKLMLMQINWIIMRLTLIAPFILFSQMFPTDESETKVK